MKKCEICRNHEASNYYVNDRLVILWVCDECLEKETKKEEN